MKTFIVMLIIVFVGLHAAAQTTTKDTTAKVKPVAKPYTANPYRVYNIQLTETEIISLLQTSHEGIVPFYQTTATPMSQLPAIQLYYQRMADRINAQYLTQWQADRKQFVTDSLKAIIKPKHR